MTSREWPVHRAQAKCARIAACFLEDDTHPDEAQALLRVARGHNCFWDTGYGPRAFAAGTESGFRDLIAAVLSWGPEEIEPAVAWVYGEAPAVGVASIPCERPTNVFRTPGGVQPEKWRTR